MVELIERLRGIVAAVTGPDEATGGGGAGELSPRVAVAVLMIAVMEADGRALPEERARIDALLAEAYALDADGVAELRTRAEREGEASADHYAPTALLRRSLEMDQRVDLMRLLFEVAYADGELHESEDALLRLVSDRLGMDPRDRVLLRREVAARTGGNVIASS